MSNDNKTTADKIIKQLENIADLAQIAIFKIAKLTKLLDDLKKESKRKNK